MPAVVTACATTPPLRHDIIQGTDGGFAVTVQGAGTAADCRAEALRIGHQEVARRGLSASILDPAHVEASDRDAAGRRLCTARLPVSTLPPWR